MDTVVLILQEIVLTFLNVFQIALLLRAIMNLIDRGEPGAITSFLIFFTEPFIVPIRIWFDRMRWFEGSVFDMPFLTVVILTSVLQTLLSIF